ncbi:cytochrome P450 [Mycolicibacterium phlei DSM 43239 = CCUG 21000]|uniref:Steroid C26-monooxygenase n=1 Tax=Mycolicibacterium phlei DSM 43239 = CCUG 21000 TaxID=1226750 RepID=A0A5N5V082_MYCPH|nr:cytochrome P450 [Mycolicibacterium phlei]KAB7755293.1 cytochrome P450 [Mycolicibacterium phlei DSM 43239 = CCUG 21000]
MSQTGGRAGEGARRNAPAAIRPRRRGYTGWTGAINTDYDPQDPATAAQPFDAYRALHRGGRVHYNPRRATFIVAGLDDVRAALRDTDQVTSSQGVTRLRFSAPLAVLTDGDEHARLRRQVQPGFSRGAMESWQEIVEKLAVELVIELLNNPGCDVVTRLAIPMPIRLIAAILGVPDTDLDDFRRWSERGVGLMELKPTITGVADAARSAVAMAALHRYFRRQFAAGRLKGSDTVLGRLLAHNTDGSLTDQQLLLIAIHLLIAGNETTTNLLGGMFDTFARHPDQYDLIRANPDLIPLAVEEHLRFTTPIQNLYRYTRADYRIGDVVIPTGSRVLLSFGAANRDPTVFDEPDEFRADRDPRKHVAFGYGAHMCLGAPLARMEAQAVLRQLVTRVARISPAGPTKWSTHSSLRGPTRLPIHLTPA